jgi:hypothetical protein
MLTLADFSNYHRNAKGESLAAIQEELELDPPPMDNSVPDEEDRNC